LGIKFYFEADLRYEIGSYYKVEDKAVTYVKFHNHGKSDAENVALNVEFPTNIVDYSTDNPLVVLNKKKGGNGSHNFIGNISAIHPGESLTIYFTVINPPNIVLPYNFLKQSTYKNGITKTGKPFWFSVLVTIFVYLITLIPFYFYSEKNRTRHYETIDELIKLAKQAEKDNLSKPEYMNKVKELIGSTRFRKKGLLIIAESAFIDTPTG
jgi:hypothetical protein